MKVSEGFSIADSRNLPKVDYMMLLQYMRENDSFNVAEIRGAKTLMSSRESYVETAIGYVEVKRENTVCILNGRVTPEHKVRSKMYTVRAIINESEDIITEVKCDDCPASEGGCKHAICFIMWLIKRTEEPSVTSVACYWTQPRLSEAVTKDKFILAKEIPKTRTQPRLRLSATLDSFLAECKKRKLNDSLIINYTEKKETLDKYSVFDLILSYNLNAPINSDNLKSFAEQLLTSEIKDEIEKQTRGQATNKLWHTLRQGRITASKIHEATKCTTDGSLVQIILGGYKVPETKAIKRGKLLEGEVIKKLEEDLKMDIQCCGFMLITPFIGASPDGLCDEFTIEIKCPMTTKSRTNYVNENKIAEKIKAQVQVQMYAAKKKKALLCIADPQFETNKLYQQYWLYYDKLYVKNLIKDAEVFWKNYIFEKILESANI